MICPVCGKEEAIIDVVMGILPGVKCKERRDSLKSPDHLVEFTSPQIRQDRKEYKKDIEQPFRGNEASKEFLDAYPDKAKKIFSKREIKNIKNVWT